MNEKHKEKIELQKLNRNDPFHKSFPMRYKIKMTPELRDYKYRLDTMLKKTLYCDPNDEPISYFHRINPFQTKSKRKSYFNNTEKALLQLLRKRQNQFHKKLMIFDELKNQIVLNEIDELDIFPEHHHRNYELKMLKINQEIALIKLVILEKRYEPHRYDKNIYKFFIKSAIVEREKHSKNRMIIKMCYEIDKFSPLMYPDDYEEEEYVII